VENVLPTTQLTV